MKPREREGMSKFWRRDHCLDRMTIKDLTLAFFQHHSTWAYFSLAVIFSAIAFWQPTTSLRTGASILSAVFLYPLAWYTLHRWVLHGRWLFKSPLTAAVWKRIHYDHHQDPNRLDVLFGALYTTLPTVAIVTLPVGYLIGGVGGSATAFSTGLLITCAYEYVHCIEHLPFKPRSRLLANMKRRHLAHHFHDETGNFGITSFVWDRAFGTFYERRERPDRSPTVLNLGYDHENAELYPWVSNLSRSADVRAVCRRGRDSV
jgi:sterol desaturase/sphingolipid hydroxylase (fatty acid hydroxylase superfamily)